MSIVNMVFLFFLGGGLFFFIFSGGGVSAFVFGRHLTMLHVLFVKREGMFEICIHSWAIFSQLRDIASLFF